ncbi:MAG: hypothetical protein J6B09_07250 [Clostridia bacterium]|nr:hypothetical protein [Clostridia bacterium]
MNKDKDKDIDWKETEWLVTQLRAKIDEDRDPSDHRPSANGEKQSATSERTSTVPAFENQQKTQYVSKKKRKKAKRAAQLQQNAAEAVEPAVGEAPAQEPVVAEPSIIEKSPVAEESLVATEAPTAEQASVFEEDVEEKAVTEEAKSEAIEAARPAVPTEPVKKAKPHGVPLSQKRSTLFAASYDREEPSDFKPVQSADEDVGARPPVQVSQLRTEEELRAEETVEDLLYDLFGSAEDSGWFADKKATSTQKEQQKPKKDSIFVAATQRIKKNEPAAQEPVQQTAPEAPSTPKPAKIEPQVQTDFETITRERDGQIALVLPETGKPLAIPAGESERQARAEEQTVAADEAQLGLFTKDVPDPSAPGADPTRDKNEFKRSIEASDEDFRLLLDLDYENELGKTIGFEKICAYHEEGVNGQAVIKRRRRRGAELREYELQGQDTALRKQYTKQKRDHVLRLALSAALTVLIWIYEQTAWMANLFGGPFDGEKYPASYILIGLQLLVILAFFSGERIFKGFMRLIRFSPIDYSLCSVILLTTVLYHLVLIFLPHSAAPSLYLSPAAITMTFLALADLLDWYRESLAFQVISSRKQKYALIPRVSVGGEQGDARYRLMQSDAAGTTWYVRPVGFVRNYFANTKKRVGNIRFMGTQLLLIASIGVTLGLYALATGGTATQMLQTVFVTFLLCVPATSLFLTSLPMFLAACLRLQKKGAIIGEEPIDQCDDTTTLVMPDSEVFGAMHHERFEIMDGQDPFLVSILVRALLEKIQSPLCDSVSVDRNDRIGMDQVVLTEIAEQGVAANVSEQGIPMLLGSAAYMQSHGVAVQDRWTNAPEHRGRRLICVAIKDRIVAIFLARYRLADDMKALLLELEAEGVQIVIRSKDPGIHDDLFASLLPDRKDAVKVMKPSVSEIDLRTDRVDATVVALGSCREAARTFVTCRRVRRAGNLGKLLQVLSIAGGAVLAAVLTFLAGAVRMPAILVSLYLLFWCGVHAATSYFYLRDRDEDRS